jgi:hypothetical protein
MVDLGDARTDGVKLGLKLYHAREFQLDSQQLAAEAPFLAVLLLGSCTDRSPFCTLGIWVFI